VNRLVCRQRYNGDRVHILRMTVANPPELG
jgi:hypothetical protein